MRIKKRVKKRVKKGIKSVKSAPPEAYKTSLGGYLRPSCLIEWWDGCQPSRGMPAAALPNLALI